MESLIDFKKINRLLFREITASIERVLRSEKYILAGEVKAIEDSFAEYCGSKYCVAVGNGFDAIRITLMSLDIGPGDEVITTTLSAPATALAIKSIGAKPVFVDIFDKTYNMDHGLIERSVTPSTKAILPVHLYGQCADMDEIKQIAMKRKLFVIEDACQAHGSEYKGRKAGSLADAGCFSFYPTKNLGCLGDGGAITTNNKKIYEKAAMLRNYGAKDSRECLTAGINSRLDEIQAAILRIKLKYLDKINEQKNEYANRLCQSLENLNITLPLINNYNYSNFHLFVVRCGDREELRNKMSSRGMLTDIHYPIPLHKQKIFRQDKKISLPVSEKICREIFSILFFN